MDIYVISPIKKRFFYPQTCNAVQAQSTKILAQIWHASGTIPPMEAAQNLKAISPTSGTKINNHPPGAFLTLHKVTPVGALQVRKRESGAVTFYWRYSIGNKSERVSIGQYDSVAPPKSLAPTRKGYSIAGATRAAELLAADHHSNRGIGGRPALKAAELASKAEIARQRHHAVAHTLENLLNHYSDHLETLGRSHRETRSIFKCHVFDPWPEYKALIANEVNDEQMANMIRKVAESGKGRTANKLRSYLRAAYETARTSRTKGSVPAHFKDYEVRTNPAADTSPDESKNRSDKDPLTIEELRIYWRNIKKLPGLPGAVLRVHLLSGAQRIEQLVRLLSKDVSRDAFRIFDGKGRPGSPPRSHLVPVITILKKSVAVLSTTGTYAISTDGGVTHIAGTTLSSWAKVAGADIKGFKAKRLRSGVETLLAKEGISREIRGHLQSHGISGVQAKHYDGYDYFKEKNLALETLFSKIDSVNKP